MRIEIYLQNGKVEMVMSVNNTKEYMAVSELAYEINKTVKSLRYALESPEIPTTDSTTPEA